MLKISSSLVRQVNTAAFEEVIKKKAATKKVFCLPFILIVIVCIILKVPIMSKNVFRSSYSTSHQMNFCEKIFRFG